MWIADYRHRPYRYLVDRERGLVSLIVLEMGGSRRERIIFSCFNQDRPLDLVDFDHLHARLRQNSLAEELPSLWIDHMFEEREVQEV